MVITYGVRGDDLPMDFLVIVDEDRQLLRMVSPFQFKMDEAKRVEGAIITCAATERIANGCFDYDFSDGSISFRMNQIFMDCEIGEELIRYMINVSVQTVDEYNDKFFMVSKGMTSLDDFLGSL